ncbi:hypothetical protein C0989_000752, partial [Termitomyces sp. Mn162]
MKRRGIHDIFHAALLRIHKPNDNQLFPGRLDEQIVEPEVNKWAAECIVVHHGSKTHMMFELLWKAGDKLWMSYNQVKELELLVPYLEFLGHKKIEELIESGTGKLPLNDPQIFLGLISFIGYKGADKGEGTHVHHPTVRPPTSSPASDLLSPHSCSHCISTSMAHPFGNRGKGNSNSKGHPLHHPFVTIDSTTRMVILFDPWNPDNPLVVHPLQLHIYLEYELEICQTRGHPRSPFPMGYETIANILNLANPATECQYRLAEYDHQTETWSKVKTPFPTGFLPTAFVDPCLDLLTTLRFITKQGNVDEQTVEDAVWAWRAPSSERVQRTKQFHAQQSQHLNNPIHAYYPPKQSHSIMNKSNSTAGPGPSTTYEASKRRAVGPHHVASTASPRSVTSVHSTASTPTLHPAITANSIIIRSPDRKGKGKARADEEEMAIDPTDVPLPEDDEDNAEGEPEDGVEADPMSDLSAAG